MSSDAVCGEALGGISAKRVAVWEVCDAAEECRRELRPVIEEVWVPPGRL